VYDSGEHHELKLEFWRERFDLNPECPIIRQNYIDSKREFRALQKKMFDELKSNDSRKLNFFYHNDTNRLWKKIIKRKSDSKEQSDADLSQFFRDPFSNDIFHEEFEQHYERVDSTVQIKSMKLEKVVFNNFFSFFEVEKEIDRLSVNKGLCNDDDDIARVDKVCKIWRCNWRTTLDI
jgi:hypothetical protein